MKWSVVITVIVSLMLLVAVAGSAEPGGELKHEWDAADEAEEDDDVQAPPAALRVLNDRSFEHDTQAATGQTTGIWLILFISSACEQCGDVESALLLLHSQLEGGSPIIAKVNISECTRTAKRFNVKDAPQLKLFRDRHMMSYKGQWSAASINSFILDGWKSAPAEDVPAEVGLTDEIQERFSALSRATFEYLGNSPGIMACLGTMSAMSGYVVTKQWLIKKHKPKRPRGRPRKHVH